MTVRQIIQEIEALPLNEQQEVRSILATQDHGKAEIKYADHEKAMVIAERILNERAELFQKLAQ